MKRLEHYCDQCGALMSKQDADGDSNVFGVFVKGYAPDATLSTEVRLIIDTNDETSCGSTSKRFELSGSEFCSPNCFGGAIGRLMAGVCQDSIKDSIK